MHYRNKYTGYNYCYKFEKKSGRINGEESKIFFYLDECSEKVRNGAEDELVTLEWLLPAVVDAADGQIRQEISKSISIELWKEGWG